MTRSRNDSFEFTVCLVVHILIFRYSVCICDHASDAWKFCQNWTTRRGESNLAKFPNITSTINLELYEQHRMIICLLLA